MHRFHHVVHFWLKPDLTAQQREDFMAGLANLGESENVSRSRVGVPAGTDRPVVDNTYDAQLLCEFQDAAAHDRYQSDDDEVHAAFIREFKTYWTKVLIYDSVEPEDE